MAEKTHKQPKKRSKAASKKQLTFSEPEEASAEEVNTEAPAVEEAEQAPEKVDTITSEADVVEPPQENTVEQQSVQAKTHARKPIKPVALLKSQKKWQKVAGLIVGVTAVVALIVSGVLSQYFKNKTMPNVWVAGVKSTAKDVDQLKSQLERQKSQFTVTLQANEKVFKPTTQEIGWQLDVDKTVKAALLAKRNEGLLARLAFWSKRDIPAVVSINDTLLGQYVEAQTAHLSKPPQDARLEFIARQGEFSVSPQADGEGADTQLVKQSIEQSSRALSPVAIQVKVVKKPPVITEAKLAPLVAEANTLVTRKVTLSGLGYRYQARPADIATWITPTPEARGKIILVVDPAKVQSYIDTISKQISNAPVDKKVLRDEATGNEVVLQAGRDGTELADKQTLANSIVQALKSGQDSTQTMNITTAAFKTVNMNAYDKWIEVDLSEQRTTAYERATPVKNFLIASGMKGHETVVGEFAIWLKVRKQTMQGGSKADGSYYSLPNVEWVSYFYKDYALHGAWWREKFGAPASHGCVNMTNADAKWLYEWAPVGTKVIVHS